MNHEQTPNDELARRSAFETFAADLVFGQAASRDSTHGGLDRDQVRFVAERVRGGKGAADQYRLLVQSPNGGELAFELDETKSVLNGEDGHSYPITTEQADLLKSSAIVGAW